MGSIVRKFKDKADKRAFMTRNGATVLKELIASSHGKYNPYRIFSAKELEIATNNYDERNFLLPGRAFKLYKGLSQERLISVMKFDDSEDIDYDYAYENCINNITYAAQMSHKHILKLIGCCLETPIPILVFESVEYGTLRDRILGASQPQFEPLLLKHRLKIAMDAANALAYVHFGFPRPIVFRDFQTSKILFGEENVGKLFDFSLSKSIPEGETHISDIIIGTFGYMAPEYALRGVLNEKSDVYSFGVFLFELLTGQKPDDPGYPLALFFEKFYEDNSFTEMVDPIIIQDILCLQKEQQLHAFAQLALDCLKAPPEDRPTMVDVAKKLRQIYCSFM